MSGKESEYTGNGSISVFAIILCFGAFSYDTSHNKRVLAQYAESNLVFCGCNSITCASVKAIWIKCIFGVSGQCHPLLIKIFKV